MPIVADTGAVPAALSVEGLCRHMNKLPAPTDPAVVDELQMHLVSAVGIVNHRCGPLSPATVTRKVTAGAGYLVLPPGPVTAVTEVHGPDGEPLTADEDYEVDLAAGVISIPHCARGRWSVTFTAGYPADGLPRALELAIYIIAAHLWGTQRPGKPRRLPGGMGSDDEPTPLVGFAVPNRALELMEDYTHAPGVQ